MLKIIAGKYRGKKIIPHDTSLVRPTSHKAREAIFNSLKSNYPDGFDMIFEPFAGTGAMSFEALSQELVKEAFLCEKKYSVSAILENNIKKFKDSLKITVLNKDATTLDMSFLENKKALVFIDPPYKESELIKIVFDNIKDILGKGSLIICESESETPPIENPIDSRTSGRAFFYLYSV
ncbi:MAG: RsmD family RNA methyltransferase [Alphaproteobacteria bacterium]